MKFDAEASTLKVIEQL